MGKQRKLHRLEYVQFRDIKQNNKLLVEDAEFIAFIHSKYFKHSYYVPCSCSPKVWNEWIAQLNNIYDLGYRYKLNKDELTWENFKK
jgi:hypothetical protein